MSSKFCIVLLVSLLVGLTIAVESKPAEANWKLLKLQGPNQGYCKDGRQHADISRCRENRTNAPVQRKDGVGPSNGAAK
jgi:hypothetical protein